MFTCFILNYFYATFKYRNIICNTRDVVLEFRNSRSAILVATDVAARGLGKILQINRYDVRVRLRWLFHICESRDIVMWQRITACARLIDITSLPVWLEII